jgi:hypothetical protein
MQLIPLAAVPSQQFGITLDGQNCTLSVYQKTTGVYFDMLFNGLPFTSTVRCLNEARLCEDRQYLGFEGDFIFYDTQGDSDPSYTGLGSRFILVFLEAADLAAIAAAGLT